MNYYKFANKDKYRNIPKLVKMQDDFICIYCNYFLK